MTFPSIFVDWLGRFAGFVSLNFSLMLMNAEFWELQFYVVASLSLLLCIFILAVLAVDKPRTVKQHEKQLQEYLDEQVQRVQEERDPQRLTPLARMLWLCVVGMTTLYLPCTNNAIIGISCHRMIQCYFDCYNEPRHMAVVYVGAVCLLVVVFGRCPRSHLRASLSFSHANSSPHTHIRQS